MSLGEKFLQWDERNYVDYFRKPIYRSIWFGFGTAFFALAFGHQLWMLSKHWTAIPSAMQITFLCATLCTPLVWVRAIRQHRLLRQMVLRGLGLAAEAERQLFKEIASSSVFFVWMGYVVINLVMEVMLHLVWRN